MDYALFVAIFAAYLTDDQPYLLSFTVLKLGTMSYRIDQINKHLSPSSYPQELLQHLNWIKQKDSLHQGILSVLPYTLDIFLLSIPSPLPRQIILEYCRLSNRPYEYIALSRDTTEADLKQRREIKNSSAIWIDCAVVSAAINGRILIIEGIERAERNVLPVLNNILENREIGLEDGRFIVSHGRYDGIVGDRTGLVRCHPKFLIVAIGLSLLCGNF
jgi:hypothetical protein